MAKKKTNQTSKIATRDQWYRFLMDRKIKKANEGPFPIASAEGELQSILLNAIRQEVMAILDSCGLR